MPGPLSFRAAFFVLAALTPSLRADAPLRERIDAEVRAAWTAHGLTPAARSTDAEFLRRLYLDLVGNIPAAAEAKAFLADADPKKRDALIDRLLADPRFNRHQADVWDLALFGRNPPGGDAVRKRDPFKTWLADQFARDVPYDHWVKDLLLAEADGTELFYVQFRGQPEDAATAVSRVFLGTQIHCARCHDHPFDKWTQKDFYGLAGFFVRLVVTDGSGANARFKVGEKSTGEVLFTGAAKDQKPGQKGEPVKPKFLGGPALDEPPLPKDFKEPARDGKAPPKPMFSRKEKLAGWVGSADNPFLARAAANRVWGQFLGRGLVHPVDDLTEQNKPSHPALLDLLAKELAAHQFNLKWLIRELVSTQAYQLSGVGPAKDALPKWFDRARVRPLQVEELVAAMRTATGFDADGKNAPLPGAGSEFFLRYFGEPTNGQGEFQGSLGEHLFLNNSDVVRGLIRPKKGNLADTLIASKAPVAERVDHLFLAVLSRLPTESERKLLTNHLGGKDKPDALVEDAIWALLNAAEFRFNH
jgi:hypothetical protein